MDTAPHQPMSSADSALLTLASAMPSGLLVLNREGVAIHCNPAAARILRLDAKRMIGTSAWRSAWQLRDETGAALAPDAHPMRICLATGEAQPARMLGIDGLAMNETLWLLTSATPGTWPGPDGSMLPVVLCILNDVSVSRRTAQRISADSGWNTELLDHLPVQVTIYDLAGRVLYINATGEGRPEARRQRIGRTDREYFSGRPEWRDLARQRAQAVAHCVASGEVVMLQETLPAPAGGHTFTRIHMPMTATDGSVQKVACYGIETTREHQADEARRQTEARYTGLVERLPLITYVAALDTRRTPLFVNSQIEQILGYTPDQWMEEPSLWRDSIHEQDRSKVDDAVHRMMAGTGRLQVEYRLRRADGVELWFNDEALLVPGGNGESPRIEGFLLDVTARHRAEETIERLADVVDASQDAVLNLAPDGTIQACNAAVETIYGRGRDELVGQSMAALIQAADGDVDAQAMRRVTRGHERVMYDAVHRHASGAEVNVTVTLSPLLDATGEVSGVAMIARDTTQRRSLETQLRQAQKMEAIGKLAGGIAHDFNNLLTAITGYTELVLEELDGDSPLRPDLLEVSRAAERASWLTRQLLAFSRRQVMAPEVLNLNEVVESMEKLMRRLIGEDILLETHLAPDLGAVRVDPIQVEQVLMNLAVNSRDAMPMGGTLRIETANAEVDPDLCRRYVSVNAGQSVLLTVSDTGVGMDEATQARMFEPFFTTKDTGKGTGLGLSTAYGIVKQSGGSIWAESTPGQGTIFRVYLPRADAASDGEEDFPVGTPTGPAPRVLLVEDQEAVLQLTMAVLRRAGYEVTPALNGETALRLAGEAARSFDLLLTDVVMPGMSGSELAAQLKQQQPDLKVLYMSGHSETQLVRHGVVGGEHVLMTKPFRPEALLSQVRATLEG